MAQLQLVVRFVAVVCIFDPVVDRCCCDCWSFGVCVRCIWVCLCAVLCFSVFIHFDAVHSNSRYELNEFFVVFPILLRCFDCRSSSVNVCAYAQTNYSELWFGFWCIRDEYLRLSCCSFRFFLLFRLPSLPHLLLSWALHWFGYRVYRSTVSPLLIFHDFVVCSAVCVRFRFHWRLRRRWTIIKWSILNSRFAHHGLVNGWINRIT